MLGFVCDFRSKGGRVFARQAEEWKALLQLTNFCNLYTKVSPDVSMLLHNTA
jgi:hypothetical protein